MISPTSAMQSLQNVQNPLAQGYAATNMIQIHGGRDGAINYPVQIGYTALLIDEENKMFFIKANDVNGTPRPLREFKYEEITSNNTEKADTSNFVTKDEFNNLLNEVKKLQNNGGHRYNNYNKMRRNKYDGQSRHEQ